MVGTLSMVFLLCYIVATLNIGTRILDVHANTKIRVNLPRQGRT